MIGYCKGDSKMSLVKMILICAVSIVNTAAEKLFFQVLLEQPGINKNSFLCTGVTSGGVQGCKDTQVAAHGFNIAGGKTLLFFNNQQYWLQQEAIAAQNIATARNYTGSLLQQQLQNEGWLAMGGYAVVISTDPLLADYIMPLVVASAGQIKVIVQLWYNGSDLIQLWSQDAHVFASGSSFQVAISSTPDAVLPSLFAASSGFATAHLSWVDNFLLSLGLQVNNRLNTDYNAAVSSPRQVRIALVS